MKILYEPKVKTTKVIVIESFEPEINANDMPYGKIGVITKWYRSPCFIGSIVVRTETGFRQLAYNAVPKVLTDSVILIGDSIPSDYKIRVLPEGTKLEI